MYSVYSQKLQPKATRFSASCLKVKKNFRKLLLEAEAAVTSHCDGCYSTVASGLRTQVTKILGIVLESFRCVFKPHPSPFV